MAVDLTARLESRETLRIPIDGEELKIEYNRNVLTKKRLRALSVFANDPGTDSEEANEKATITLFCEVIKEWDLTNKGKPVPINPETFESMDVFLLQAIAGKLTETIFPNLTPAAN